MGGAHNQRIMESIVPITLLAVFHVCLAIDVPEVTLMNAALSGTKMPVTGIGTGAYVHEPRTQPGEIWTDDVAEKAVGQWLALGGRRIDAAYNYLNQVKPSRQANFREKSCLSYQKFLGMEKHWLGEGLSVTTTR